MKDERLKDILKATTLEEYGEATYQYMKPEKQLERIDEVIDSVVSLVGESFSQGKESIKFNGMIASSDIEMELYEALFRRSKHRVDDAWDIKTAWKIDSKKDEAIVTWKNK